MDSSRRDLSIDMVVDRFILKNYLHYLHYLHYHITLSVPPLQLKQVWYYLKQGLIFAVQITSFPCFTLPKTRYGTIKKGDFFTVHHRCKKSFLYSVSEL